MNNYNIRFNTEHNGSKNKWRVFENGNEMLFEHIDIRVNLKDNITLNRNGEEKYNVFCQGYLTVINKIAIITPTKTEFIESKIDWNKPTVQMLGRWQPWHKGHRALFERLLSKTNQVVIQIRKTSGNDDSNPFDINTVIQNINNDLHKEYFGKYQIQVVPNIVHIGWGRGVGYTSGEETFDESITKISATDIRSQMNSK